MESTSYSSLSTDWDDVTLNDTNSFLYSSTVTLTTPEENLRDFIEYRIAINIKLVYTPVIASLGIVGNMLSLYVLLFSSFRKSTASWYLATIAVLDTLILIYSILNVVDVSLPNCGIYNHITCPLIQFMFYFSIHFDVLVLVAMTIERFIVVRFPLRTQTMITKRRTLSIIIGIGVFSLGLNSYNIFIRVVTRETASGQCRCWTDGVTNVFFLTQVYTWIDSTIYYLIPATSLFIFNILIMVYVHRAKKQIQAIGLRSGESQRSRYGQGQRSTSGESQGQHTQVTSMLILVSLAFLVFVSPIGIILMLERTGLAWRFTTTRERAVQVLVEYFTDSMMYTNHGVNFIFYCLSGRRFRNELRRLCCFKNQEQRPKIYNVTTALRTVC